MSEIPLAHSFLQLLCTSALSAWGLYLSYHNITRLQAYEKQSEKAAEWSNTAADRLHKTRSTQTSGTVSITQLLLSFLTPFILLASPYRYSATILITAAIANTAMLFVARTHMANFWNESNQTRIPFVQKFNDAVRGSERVVWVLGAAGSSWGLAAAGWVAMGRGWI